MTCLRFTTTHLVAGVLEAAAHLVVSGTPDLRHLTGPFVTMDGFLQCATADEIVVETDEVNYLFCRRHFDDLQVQVHP
jgi:hypothetical protein